MSLADTLQNRKNLEQTAKIKHDIRFDDLERRSNQHLLIVVAVVAAVAYAVGIDMYYRTKYTVALEGHIQAKSEMSKAEIKALNIAKAPSDKRK